MNLLYLFLAILPGVLIGYYIFHLDKYEKESYLHLALCFGMGMAIIPLAILLENWIVQEEWLLGGNFHQILLYSFIGVALVEEGLKFGGLLIHPYFRNFFNEPMDGIVYTAMIGMGFATLENVYYAQSYGLETVLVRAFTAIPAHASFAIIMGYYVGLAKFDALNRFKYMAKGLGFAILAHGLYDFFLLQEWYSGLTLLAMVTLTISIIFARRMILLHQINSPFRVPTSVEIEEESADEV